MRQSSWWKVIGVGGLLAVLAVPDVPAQSAGPRSITRADYVEAYQARRDSLIRFYAYRYEAADFSRGGYFDIAARLTLGIDQRWVLARLDSLLSQPPRGDMFWMFPFVTAWFAGRETLPDRYKARLRDLWRTYMPYRGDTENHWAHAAAPPGHMVPRHR